MAAPCAESQPERTVSVLFARADSCYKGIPGCDVWDLGRNAMLYDDDCPIVAHPPCRAWGRLRTFARPVPGERNTARLAVALVRKNGGVLEHPQGSGLWVDQGLPGVGERDQFGGWTLPISQAWWGHKAEKKTWLYIVGCEPKNLPVMPMRLGDATHVIQSRKRHDCRPHVTKAEREHTPFQLAVWLVELARLC